MKRKNLYLASPQNWPAWLGLGLLWLITRLPQRWQLSTGRAIGNILYFFPSPFKKTTEINIKKCFPDYTPEQQKALAKKNFQGLALGIIEAGMAWWLPENKLPTVVNIQGMEHLESALAKGKGAILISPHFTCLEIAGRLFMMRCKFDMGTMYRPHKKPIVRFIHENYRIKKSVTYIQRHRLRDLIRALNNNIGIWYAYDVDGGRKRSVFAPFFGIQTASLTSVSRIVKLSGTAVIPITFYRRENEFAYDICLSPALENFPGDDLTEDATRLNADLEAGIRNRPDQYVWQYKRFKTRPMGEKRFY